VTFTNAQWAQLQQVFPAGVCDFSKRGVDQQPTIPWQTYQDAAGDVIYGGKPLPAAPAADGLSSGAFQATGGTTELRRLQLKKKKARH
jgi:hypothetical protein